jgi:transcriptional regulator GlxA family with amidase domain
MGPKAANGGCTACGPAPARQVEVQKLLTRSETLRSAKGKRLGPFPSRAATKTAPRRLSAARTRLLQAALDYIRDHLHAEVYVADIARALGVGQRTLHTLFHRHLGMPPMQWIKHERLLKARQMLESTNPVEGSVKVAAISVGFRDMGRFSIEYHSMFNEVPSATLRQARG